MARRLSRRGFLKRAMVAFGAAVAPTVAIGPRTLGRTVLRRVEEYRELKFEVFNEHLKRLYPPDAVAGLLYRDHPLFRLMLRPPP